MNLETAKGKEQLGEKPRLLASPNAKKDKSLKQDTSAVVVSEKNKKNKNKKEGAPASPDEGEEEEGGEGEGGEAQAKAEQEQEQVVNPKLVQLPNLKVAHFYDPDSGNEIMTREDLVVVMTSTEHRTCLVQHADGTYIHSETKEIYHAQDVVTSGKLMMEQITEVFPTKQHPLIGDKIANIPPDRPGLQISTFASPQTKHSATWPPLGYGEAPQDIPEHVWPPREQTSPKERYTTPPPDLPQELRDPQIEVSTTWHVRKDGQPKVHGKVGEQQIFFSSLSLSLPDPLNLLSQISWLLLVVVLFCLNCFFLALVVCSSPQLFLFWLLVKFLFIFLTQNLTSAICALEWKKQFFDFCRHQA
jgi:hypothetical protein